MIELTAQQLKFLKTFASVSDQIVGTFEPAALARLINPEVSKRMGFTHRQSADNIRKVLVAGGLINKEKTKITAKGRAVLGEVKKVQKKN